MELWPRTFSFVDRITFVEPGVRVRGHYVIPTVVDSFPASLVAEAVGQLAAWAAMAAIGYSHRPVAGIAGAVELLGPVQPGQVLELAAELEVVDTETVGYSGTAHAVGAPVLRLLDCVGPMVPVEEFDDPQALRERFKLLTAGGAPAGGFRGLPALELKRVGGEPAQVVRTQFQVPSAAPFFADHFPRRAVFPGTLLMHANLQSASMLAVEASTNGGPAWVPRLVSDVKLRAFISPGEALDLEAKRLDLSGSSLNVAVESRINQRLIGSARIQFAREVRP